MTGNSCNGYAKITLVEKSPTIDLDIENAAIIPNFDKYKFF